MEALLNQYNFHYMLFYSGYEVPNHDGMLTTDAGTGGAAIIVPWHSQAVLRSVPSHHLPVLHHQVLVPGR
eukprot:9073120-Pyramimonas_sp.AAC.1